MKRNKKFSILVISALLGFGMLIAITLYSEQISPVDAKAIGQVQYFSDSAKNEDEPAALAVLLDYVDFSTKGEFSKLETVAVDIRKIRPQLSSDPSVQTLENKIIRTEGGKEVMIVSLDLTKWDIFEYEILTQDEPQYIKNKRLSVKTYLFESLDENECRIRVDFINEKGEDDRYMDYYLFKDATRSWKIYKTELRLAGIER